MLDITKLSLTAVYEDDWRKEKLGKISGSLCSELISANSHKGEFDKGAKTYLDGLAWEIVTGTPARPEFFTNATNYGNAHEAEAIDWSCEQLGLFPLRNEERKDTHRLIILDEYSGVTPDGLLVKNEKNIFSSDGNFIMCKPLEVKAPPIATNFLKLYKCQNAKELEKVNPSYYWQCIMQLYAVQSLEGFFAVYHPDFPKKGKVLTFKKSEHADNLKKLDNTLYYAKEELKRIVEMLKN